MLRCPLCKTKYPNSVSVCKIDGSKLVRSVGDVPTPPILLGTQPLGEGDLQSVMAAPRGKVVGASLVSMVDNELTAAAQPEAMAARAKEPPRIATGSGTVAPRSKARDEWSKPFLEAGLDVKKPEAWLGKSLGVYKLLSILGKGGMGCVYLAEHERLGREVALKVLRSDYSERKDAVARFFQEARAVNKIRHRNIVDVTDFVELDSGVVFIIMEYLRGAPLTKLMRSKTGLDPVRALGILVQICDGLAAAHAVGIVHRDLKPDNIIIAQDHSGGDLVKLLDFGVAKLLDQDDDDVALQTAAGSVVGTPAFMSPEQAGGSEVDGRADLYSLGAIMYEIFTKQPLFKGKSFGEFVRKHLNETPTRPTHTRAGRDMHPRAEELILHCIEKNPDNRFQTAQELRIELLSLLATLETTGEITSHLRKMASAAVPIGAASPGGGRSPHDSSHPPYYTPHSISPVEDSSERQSRDSGVPHAVPHASVPGIPHTGIPHVGTPHVDSRIPMAEVLVSSGSESGSEAGLASPSELLQSPMPGLLSGSQPPLPSSVHSGVQPLAFSDSRLGATYPTAGQSSVLEPPQQGNLRTMGIAVVLLASIAVVVFVARRPSSTSTTKNSHATPVVVSLDAESSDTTAPDVVAGIDPAPKPAAIDESKYDASIPKEGTRFIVVAMSSKPSAEVFAVGAVSPICKTPCDVEIDTEDGGSPTRRDFILRSDKHKNASITINLRAPRTRVFTKLKTIAKKPPTTKKKKKKKKKKCASGAQDTFNPFGGKTPCKR